ncbi:MAG: hypothetical protein U0838_08030 [Chloroflexota bacterium]
MQTRVDQLVPYGYTDTAISTFHAFGDRLLREFALELGLPLDLRVLSRPETVVFLRERVFELGLEQYRPLEPASSSMRSPRSSAGPRTRTCRRGVPRPCGEARRAGGPRDRRGGGQPRCGSRGGDGAG